MACSMVSIRFTFTTMVCSHCNSRLPVYQAGAYHAVGCRTAAFPPLQIEIFKNTDFKDLMILSILHYFPSTKLRH